MIDRVVYVVESQEESSHGGVVYSVGRLERIKVREGWNMVFNTVENEMLDDFENVVKI